MAEQLGFDLSGEDGPAAADPPPDESARARIRSDLDATLFVEAGAGAGKTSSLVERIANLVDDGVDITGVAAITFTEKAAAELRTRVRSALAARPSDSARRALERLDHAPIGTLHAFARRVLFDFPIEAGLPPGFSVLDELESGLAFEEQWDDLLDRLLDDPDPAGGIIAGGRAFVELCEFDGFGVRSGVRRIAEDFRSNWDLVDDRVSLDDPGPLRLDVDGALTLADEISSAVAPPDDHQATAIAQAATFATRVRTAGSLRVTLEAILAAHHYFAGKKSMPGNKTNWKKHPGGIAALDALRSLEFDLGDELQRLLDEVRHQRRLLLGAIVGRFVLDAARERAHSGRLEFHDLLVLARRLVAHRRDIRQLLHARYPRILLDEFQDTDPIQLEIAVRLTSRPDDPFQASDWRRLVPVPGRLFIVGDPKQSIYRFRRADIAQYLRAADQVGADQLHLTANFRSTTAVIDFVNDVFGRLIEYQPDAQPAFAPLDACRRADLLGHGTVTVLGAEVVDVSALDNDDSRLGDPEMGAADALRMIEARDVVAAITTALADGWPVFDHATSTTRPCVPGDICVLLPTRISLPALEAEFRSANLPYRAENSSVVYASSEVRALLLALRAADDPTDSLALVAALRSPLYGCSDVELWEWAAAGGTWGLWAPAPDDLADHAVADAIAHVRSIAERSGLVSPADLLAAVADERRVFDLALTGGDARDVWRRMRYVVEQARSWADAGGHGLRRYLHWAALQASESRLADTILPEHDHDAVRLMTVHAAKGLEFPITVVAGLTTKPRRSQTAGVVWVDDTWMLAGKGDDGVFVDHLPIDEQMSDGERRRLLYVACTRAVDHLVVSLYRPPPAKGNADGADQGKLTSAELLWHGGAAGPTSGARIDEFRRRPVERPVPATREVDWNDPVGWAAERRRVLATASRRSGIAATRLAAELHPHDDPPGPTDDAGLDKQPVNVELPPWQRGRYGTSIGRAVHGVLQFCDLGDGHDIDTLARSQCAAEGVIGLEDRVAALARSALRAPIVQDVVGGFPHWRELFVAATVGDRVLEGYVDLLVRTPDGLVIVDYKTDQWSGPVQTAERLERYRLQLAAYGAALESALGERIVGGILVRCVADGGADQIAVERWTDAVQEVRQLVS